MPNFDPGRVWTDLTLEELVLKTYIYIGSVACSIERFVYVTMWRLLFSTAFS